MWLCAGCGSVEVSSAARAVIGGQLDLAEVSVTETETDLTIIARDAAGGNVGRLEVHRGPYLAESEEDGVLEVDGRWFQIQVGDAEGDYRGSGYTALTLPVPPEPFATFLSDGRVEAALAGWGIHFQKPPTGAELKGVEMEQTRPRIGGVGGKVFGKHDTQRFATLPNGFFTGPGCSTGPGSDSTGCNICNRNPYLDARAEDTEESLGETPNQTIVAQLCVPQAAVGNMTVKVCGGSAFNNCLHDPTRTNGASFCASHWQAYVIPTDCGLPAGMSAKCAQCVSWSSPFTPPFAGMAMNNAFIAWDAGKACLGPGMFCAGDDACCSGSCDAHGRCMP
jgi:hypothetical protein